MHQALWLSLLLTFVMPSSGILKRYANQRDEVGSSSLKADGVATAFPALAKTLAPQLGVSWFSGELNLNASVSVRFPGRCRLELASTESTKIFSTSFSQGKVHSEGASVPALEVVLEQACALLALKSTEEGATREALVRHLSNLKVEYRQVSLARFAGTVSYVLGPKEENQPSLWVYKERFLPSRVMFTDKSGTPWDVRFLDFSSQATGELWPRVMEIYQGQEPMLRVMILSANLKADLSAVKF